MLLTVSELVGLTACEHFSGLLSLSVFGIGVVLPWFGYCTLAEAVCLGTLECYVCRHRLVVAGCRYPVTPIGGEKSGLLA